MNIAVLNFSYDHWQQAALLDHAIDLLDNGNNVTWVDASSNLKKGDSHKLSLGINRIYAKSFGIHRIFKSLKTDYPNFEYKELKSFNRIGNDKEIKIENRIAMEQLVTERRDSKPCSTHNQVLIEKIKDIYLSNYINCYAFLNQEEFDYIIIFNGRFIKERSCWEAAKAAKIKVKFIERFSPQWTDKYMLFELPVHSIDYRSKIMIDFYNQSEDALKKSKAINWFEERILGLSQSFTSNQNENFSSDSDLKLISFFHSSEDELFATDLGSNYWNDQMHFLKDLISIVNKNPNYTLVVRLHPNLLNKAVREINRWKLFLSQNSSDKIKFLLPDNPINSYSLIRKSQKVITFGSTIGVEAAYMNRLSILAGSAFHQKMGMTLNVTNPRELEDSLGIDEYTSKIRGAYLNTLPYGYFLHSGGTTFKNLISNEKKPSQGGDFNYKGIKFKKPRIVSLIYHIENWFYRLKINKCNVQCTII